MSLKNDKDTRQLQQQHNTISAKHKLCLFELHLQLQHNTKYVCETAIVCFKLFVLNCNCNIDDVKDKTIDQNCNCNILQTNINTMIAKNCNFSTDVSNIHCVFSPATTCHYFILLLQLQFYPWILLLLLYSVAGAVFHNHFVYHTKCCHIVAVAVAVFHLNSAFAIVQCCCCSFWQAFWLSY